MRRCGFYRPRRLSFREGRGCGRLDQGNLIPLQFNRYFYHLLFYPSTTKGSGTDPLSYDWSWQLLLAVALREGPWSATVQRLSTFVAGMGDGGERGCHPLPLVCFHSRWWDIKRIYKYIHTFHTVITIYLLGDRQRLNMIYSRSWRFTYYNTEASMNE